MRRSDKLAAHGPQAMTPLPGGDGKKSGRVDSSSAARNPRSSCGRGPESRQSEQLRRQTQNRPHLQRCNRPRILQPQSTEGFGEGANIIGSIATQKTKTEKARPMSTPCLLTLGGRSCPCTLRIMERPKKKLAQSQRGEPRLISMERHQWLTRLKALDRSTKIAVRGWG